MDVELRGIVTGHNHQAAAAGNVLFARCWIVEVGIGLIVDERIAVSIDEGWAAHAGNFVIDISACLIRCNEEVEAIVCLVQ